ncbi:sodium-dependent nutrient amino acid transporter 1-like [Chironomus tepperi]|uniref:sodium-dependent nutrient amino acid transporter 1-like n=1 Tax=Chironomus tepperi TaxID=113505 RepID=UPI00391F1588
MGQRKNRESKPSITSVTSMSFLTQQNLTFHRFSDGTISNDGKKNPLNNPELLPDTQTQSIWTTNASLDYNATNNHPQMNESATSTTKILPSTIDESIDKNDGVKRYSAYSIGNNSTYSSTVGNNTTHTGSTMKLIQVKKDEADSSSKQSRCSIFRGTILCLCMNLTYANIVRFPRELERHGVAFLVPYLIIMFIIGVPIVLLEMALGQFLGQGASHSWKSSPFLKGASIVGRIGAWIGCIWISMHMSLSLLYIGQIAFSGVPFRQCPSTVEMSGSHYTERGIIGQLCLQKTFLRSIRESSLNFGLLAIGLVFLWVIIMMCTHSGRVNRRSIIMFGIGAMGLLLFQLGWQIKNTIEEDKLEPEFWPINYSILAQSSTWFYALIQVILSTQIGIGAIPVMTGKFLYKGDAIRMCTVYMCFNFLTTILATAYYMTPYNQNNKIDDIPPYPDLTAITSIYDRTFNEPHSTYLRKLIPSLAYLMIIFSGIISISIAIYTSSRLMKRHPNYIMCLAALCLAVGFLLCPNFIPSRYLDMRWTGLVIVCALVFDIISITWIYGIKDLSIDLEFSIGRPIMKLWLILWSTIPILLVAIVTCFIVFPTKVQMIEPIVDLIPKWIPIAICLSIILLFAIYEVTKQVDYNTFSMIHESTKAAKDWGPADPLVRHAWKQWKTVCDDTGQRDFTLKRRGTKDWTSSIKKGQYSHAKRNANCISTLNNHNKYVVNGKTLHASTASMSGGSNSPNYSGSVFGDSAIEEDISCGDKYSSNERDGTSRKSSQSNRVNRNQSDGSHHRHYNHHQRTIANDDDQMIGNYQKVPIRISAVSDHPKIKRNSYFQAQENDEIIMTDDFKSCIEIVPSDFSDLAFPPPPAQFQAQSTFMKNPLCQLSHHNEIFYEPEDDVDESDEINETHNRYEQQQQQRQRNGHLISNIHINGSNTFSDGTMSTKTTKTLSSTATHIPNDSYTNNWRKLSRNGDEFSTEL